MDDIRKLQNLIKTGFYSDAVVICSESGDIVSAVGKNGKVSEKLSDLCSVVRSISGELLKVLKRGNYGSTVLKTSEGSIVVYPVKRYYILAFINREKEVDIFEELV
ncbi:hypothetical protein [Persephonella sp.]